jgi:hypothetical protein
VRGTTATHSQVKFKDDQTVCVVNSQLDEETKKVLEIQKLFMQIDEGLPQPPKNPYIFMD